MREVLQDLIGRRVQVWSGGGSYSDTGTLVHFDASWIRLEKDGETLCFPIFGVRLLKLLEDERS